LANIIILVQNIVSYQVMAAALLELSFVRVKGILIAENSK
jgi:hypothetical protein